MPRQQQSAARVIARALLRDRTAAAESKVSFAELFFDLVFVFAVTQLSHYLVKHLTLEGVLHTTLLLVAVWIAWVYTTWAVNWLNTSHPAVRGMLFALMAAALVMSTSIPDAMGTRGLTFGIALALFHNVRNAFTVWCIGHRHLPSLRNFQRIQFWLAISGTFWIVGGFAAGPARVGLWTIAALCELGSPWWKFWTPKLGASTIDDWRVSPHHFAERCGLFVIIALGESVLVTGATFAQQQWTAVSAAAFAVAFAGTLAMWWVYFATTADLASEEFAHARNVGAIARAAYTYAHMPIVAGIILAAVGDELLLAHPGGHVEPSTAMVLIGGPALFLVGSAIFNRMMCGEFPRSHFAGLLVLGACIPFALVTTPLGVALGAVVALSVVGAVETRSANAPASSRA